MEAAEKTPPSLAEMMAALRTADDEALGESAVSRYILRDRIPAAKRREMAGASIRCGEEYARRLGEESGAATPDGVAAYYGLKVKPAGEPAGGGARLLFARFTPPDRIEILQEPLRRYRALLGRLPEAEAAGLPSAQEARDVLLGHELFHFAEDRHAAEIYTRTEKIRLWKIFGLENRTTVRALSEIAAMAFARTLCRTAYSPFALDVLLFFDYDEESARRVYQSIVGIHCSQNGRE